MGLKASVTFTHDPAKQLRGLEDRLKKNILRKAIRRGANLIKDAVKASAPERTGTLRKSISVRISLKKDSLIVTGVVGARSGYKKVIDGVTEWPSRYAGALEFGRKESVIKKKKILSDHQRFFGKRVKAAAPRNFLKSAFDSHKQQYIEAVRSCVAEEVAAALTKA